MKDRCGLVEQTGCTWRVPGVTKDKVSKTRWEQRDPGGSQQGAGGPGILSLREK